MARVIGDAAITTRAARARLKVRKEPYWRGLDVNLHLGYRAAKHGGEWIIRFAGKAKYERKVIGKADDELAADALDYAAACRRGRETYAQILTDRAAKAAGPVLTVGSAVTEYIAARDQREASRGRSGRSDGNRRLSRYVIGVGKIGKREAIEPAPLAFIELHKLEESDLSDWRAALPASLSEMSRRRLSSDLKAALNAAYSSNRKRLPISLPMVVKIGLAPVSAGVDRGSRGVRENQILTAEQIGAVLNATRELDAGPLRDGDLFALVAVLAATGARFSQVIRMQVRDVQLKERRLLVPTSRKGKGEKQSHTPRPVDQATLTALARHVTRRHPDAPLFERWRHVQATPTQWVRLRRAAWQSSSEITRAWRQIARAAGLSDEVDCYSLRHSSIVRLLRKGLPIRHVAALHDTSSVMIERHYSRWIVDAFEDLARQAVEQLIPTPGASGGNVVRLAAAQ